MINDYIMSVVVHNTEGWVLDAGSLIDRGCSRCVRFKDHKKTFVRCYFKKQCFSLCKSYGSVNSSSVANGGNTDMLQKTVKLPKVKLAPEQGMFSGTIPYLQYLDIIFKTYSCD